MINKALAYQLRVLMEGGEDITSSTYQRQQTPSDNVVVTSQQLKQFRDTLVRADSALSNAKTRCLELTRSLHNEQLAMRDAIITVDRLSQGNGYQ